MRGGMQQQQPTPKEEEEEELEEEEAIRLHFPLITNHRLFTSHSAPTKKWTREKNPRTASTAAAVQHTTHGLTTFSPQMHADECLLPPYLSPKTKHESAYDVPTFLLDMLRVGRKESCPCRIQVRKQPFHYK